MQIIDRLGFSAMPPGERVEGRGGAWELIPGLVLKPRRGKTMCIGPLVSSPPDLIFLRTKNTSLCLTVTEKTSIFSCCVVSYIYFHYSVKHILASRLNIYVHFSSLPLGVYLFEECVKSRYCLSSDFWLKAWKIGRSVNFWKNLRKVWNLQCLDACSIKAWLEIKNLYPLRCFFQSVDFN